jgi:hypothetical protein
MSFGLQVEDAGVQEAIREVASKGVLIFASASNDGPNSMVTYPARIDEVICVSAMDGLGTPFDRNPTPNTTSSLYEFAALGVAVKSAWPRKLLDPKPKRSERSERRMTGTSVATSIVAGIAACIIEFADMKDFPDDLLEKLKSRQGMQKVIRELMVDGRRHGYHYITPWSMFAAHRDDDTILLLLKDRLQSLLK